MPTTYELEECPHCHRKLTSEIISENRNEFYDACFCPYCFGWLEARCGSSKCSYCSNRPPKALPQRYSYGNSRYDYLGEFASKDEAERFLIKKFEAIGSCISLNPVEIVYSDYYEDNSGEEVAINMIVTLEYDDEGFYVAKHDSTFYQSPEPAYKLIWDESEEAT